MTQKNIAEQILELASEQRLEIIIQLSKQKTRLTEMAQIVDATKPEIHRNFERMTKSGIIQKDNQGYYSLTTIGKALSSQIPLIEFISKNKTALQIHHMDGMPEKFIQRLGALNESQNIKGMVKVLDVWKQIYQNSDSFIYDILNEIPYSSDFVEPLLARVGKGIHVKSIFSHNVIASKERKKIYVQKFRKLISEGKIERKMKVQIPALLVMNEKEACLILQNSNNEYDLGFALYSQDKAFVEWCLDYFLDSWNKSGEFLESSFNDN